MGYHHHHRRQQHLLVAILLFSVVTRPVHSILQTAAIDVLLPGVTTPLTLLASQASFGAPLANYHERTTTASSSSSSGSSSSLPAGIGVIPTTAPEDDPYLCNESFGFANYKNNGNSDNNNNNNNNYYRSALLVPRGQCSFERKALSAQRLGASAIIIYGTLSSRYSLNYTNTTANSNDAMTRTDYTFTNDVIWPTDKVDYDCNNGHAYIPSNELLNTDKYNFVKVPGGYDEQLNDEKFIGKSSNNVCVKYSSSSSSENNGNDGNGDGNNSFLSKCESQRCLVTGKNITDKTTDNGSDNGSSIKYEACCAWDFAVWLYQDTSLSETEMKEVTIPAVYITMQQATEFLDLMSGAAAAASNSNNNNNGGGGGGGGGDPIVLSIYARDRPSVNSSAIIIWAVGVFVAWIASYLSAKDYRDYSKAVMMQRELVARAGGGSGRMAPVGASAISAASANNNNEGGRPPTSPERGGARSRSQSRERGGAAAAAVNTAISPTGSGEERTIYCGDESDSNTTAILANRNIRPQEEPESLELDATHALGFIVMASTSLLVLFFFKIYNVVKIMYAFGCSGAFAQVVLHPFFTRIFRKIQWKSALRPMTCFSEENATRAALNGGCKGNILMCLWSFFGPLSLLDVMTAVIAYGVGASWLYIAFTVPHPETVAIYWIIQDVFGACMCILFLETIKINAIRVAAILLTVAFFYDIFFVFITPLLTKHGESIMINVATSGGPPKADPAWCEKYPTSAECKGGDPLPMLFSIPRIGDYQGGSSMLGLGDIVLPGLLLSFASRFDEAKRLMGLVSGGAGRRGHAAPDKSSWGLCGCCCGGGYFGPVVVAYAVGLGMANAAVYIMQYGQPALLYLVPCCLGTFCYMARKNGELNDIWDNPRVIRAADALVYGGRVETGSEDVLLDEDEDEGRAFSAMNEEAELT